MNKYQRRVHRWASKHKVPYWKPHEIMSRLTEEVGELAKEISHKYGPKKKKATEKAGSIDEEVGDNIFTLVCLCNREKIDFDKAFEMAMAKCYGRDKDRFEKK